MGRIESFNVPWPPSGWTQLGGIPGASGQSLVKDIARARIYGLQYKIESTPLFRADTRFYRHDLRIDGWEYSILNESTEYPVLSFSLYDRFDAGLPNACYIDDIRACTVPVSHTRLNAARAVGAALFLIRHIVGGRVPDVNRVLRTYKLHPGQPFLKGYSHLAEPDLKQAFSSSLVQKNAERR